MSLLQQIIDGASEDSMSTSTLLRKCLVLASKLDSQLVEQWVEWELEGYPNDVEVPEYRNLSMLIKVDMMDITTRANGWVVPLELLDENAKRFTEYQYRASMAEIEECLSKNEDHIAFKVENLFGYLISQKFTEMNILAAWCEVSTARIRHILDSVRTRTLKFALDIGKAFPAALSDEEKIPQSADAVSQIFNTTILGPANVVGATDQSKVKIEFRTGDLSAVSNALRKKGVHEDDIEEFKLAVAAEPELNGKNFGPKVSEWIGKMMRKAAEGTWAVGTGAAGNLLADIVKAYYGLK